MFTKEDLNMIRIASNSFTDTVDAILEKNCVIGVGDYNLLNKTYGELEARIARISLDILQLRLDIYPLIGFGGSNADNNDQDI